MIDKRVATPAEAVADVADGATVLVGGFGNSGVPVELVHALLEQGARDLTVVTNNAGSGETDVAALIRERRVRRIICSYPRSAGSVWFEQFWRAGEIELELVPQGTLSERMRAAGAGLGGFFTPTGADSLLAEGRRSGSSTAAARSSSGPCRRTSRSSRRTAPTAGATSSTAPRPATSVRRWRRRPR